MCYSTTAVICWPTHLYILVYGDTAAVYYCVGDAAILQLLAVAVAVSTAQLHSAVAQRKLSCCVRSVARTLCCVVHTRAVPCTIDHVYWCVLLLCYVQHNTGCARVTERADSGAVARRYAFHSIID
jgi:hypothetical protein